jgi:hypothetical protein
MLSGRSLPLSDNPADGGRYEEDIRLFVYHGYSPLDGLDNSE